MYPLEPHLYVKLRLSEIARKSVELAAASSRLTDMAPELDRLRKLTGGTRLHADRGRPSRE